FLLHCLYHLEDNGRMAIILPHGVLFRGASEGRIRKALIDKHQIEAIIGFPEKLFLNTPIPVCVVILRKNRIESDVLFVDASKGFEKIKKQNNLRSEDVEKIVDTVINRKEIEKYSHVATLDEIKENDYNLNIPRYVDTFEEEEAIDLVALGNEMVALNADIKKAETDFLGLLDELAVTADTKEIIEATKAVFR
ncbi:TPA: N-6 DNA methylase, partial [Listeria monocytogenes]|nr:N-6 DNA methylase [Listeria monocytogenes]